MSLSESPVCLDSLSIAAPKPPDSAGLRNHPSNEVPIFFVGESFMMNVRLPMCRRLCVLPALGRRRAPARASLL
jgi:hypothetical protein